ncbi:MAG: two-component system, OmpR family, sensor histidine kinase SenX3, partial [Microbacteriaceae bacterium]|nr:two-component system, OmpR family, sensor histidine kinase SenX3 [Microbacteriaceae bacterium]
MDSAWLVPLALVVGAIAGAAIVAVIVISARHGQRAADVVSTAVPDGVDQVVEALESAGVVIDPSNNVVKASPGALAFGLVWNQALVHPELVALVDQVRRSGEPVTEEIELSRGPFGDANIYLFVRVARLGARYILLLAEDRTESYRLDAVRRDFVANISHELKTPIGAVGLLAEALQAASDEPAQVRRFAKRLTKESERLARITQEIIELSRLQAADALSKPDVVDIDHVVALAIDQNHVLADSRGVKLVSGGDAGVEVYGDEPLLVVALHNLIANAIQYSPKNSRVGVGVSSVEGIVEIAVTDQGVGIPEEDLDRVFERFFRIDPARSRHTGGSGLGLSIVKHVVQNHGG